MREVGPDEKLVRGRLPDEPEITDDDPDVKQAALLRATFQWIAGLLFGLAGAVVTSDVASRVTSWISVTAFVVAAGAGIVAVVAGLPTQAPEDMRNSRKLYREHLRALNARRGAWRRWLVVALVAWLVLMTNHWILFVVPAFAASRP